MISLFFVSNSFFAGSSASAAVLFVFVSAAASPSFLASGSVEYHLDVVGLDNEAKDSCDGLTCVLANDDRGTVLMLKLNARICWSSVLGIMIGFVVSRAGEASVCWKL